MKRDVRELGRPYLLLFREIARDRKDSTKGSLAIGSRITSYYSENGRAIHTGKEVTVIRSSQEDINRTVGSED